MLLRTLIAQQEIGVQAAKARLKTIDYVVKVLKKAGQEIEFIE